MGDLMADRVSRPQRDVVLLPDAIEHADRADDRRQRVAQLVTQHRQELVLGPVGGFRLRPRELRPHQQILALLLHAPALLHERGGRDDHDRNRAHEELQQQKRFVRRGAGEGSEAAQRLPGRDAAKGRDEHHRLEPAEADRRPHERRRAQECER